MWESHEKKWVKILARQARDKKKPLNLTMSHKTSHWKKKKHQGSVRMTLLYFSRPEKFSLRIRVECYVSWGLHLWMTNNNFIWSHNMYIYVIFHTHTFLPFLTSLNLYLIKNPVCTCHVQRWANQRVRLEWFEPFWRVREPKGFEPLHEPKKSDPEPRKSIFFKRTGSPLGSWGLPTNIYPQLK